MEIHVTPDAVFNRALFGFWEKYESCFLLLFSAGLLPKNQDIAKGIAEPKFFRPPGRRIEGGLTLLGC